jgi:GT2 family glycosyltransferase
MIVSVIIPNYNGLSLLQKNLPRVLEELIKEKIRYEVLIIDDASEDGSVAWLESFIKKQTRATIRLLVNSKNLGFSSTTNKGAKEAKGDYILFLNTDVYPKSGFLEKALVHFTDPKVFAVGCMDESIEGSMIVKRGRAIAWWEKGLYMHRRGEVNSMYTDWVSGGSGIFRKELFLKLGGFDIKYNPFYWEDIDLSYRARKLGYVLIFEAQSVVVHEHEKGAVKTHYTFHDVKRISYRNQFLFVWKNATIFQFLTHILWLPYHIVSATKRRDLDFIIGFLRAIIRYFS